MGPYGAIPAGQWHRVYGTNIELRWDDSGLIGEVAVRERLDSIGSDFTVVNSYVPHSIPGTDLEIELLQGTPGATVRKRR